MQLRCCQLGEKRKILITDYVLISQLDTVNFIRILAWTVENAYLYKIFPRSINATVRQDISVKRARVRFLFLLCFDLKNLRISYFAYRTVGYCEHNENPCKNEGVCHSNYHNYPYYECACAEEYCGSTCDGEWCRRILCRLYRCVIRHWMNGCGRETIDQLFPDISSFLWN